MTTQTIDLNLVPGGVLPVVNVSQYDEQSGSLKFNLLNGNSTFTIPSGTAGLINGFKPDDTGFSYPVQSLSGSLVTCNCTKQMTALAGDVLCEIRLTKGSEIVGTSNFILRVERAPLQDDTIISETVLPLIEQAVDISANLADYIQQTLDAASDSQSAALQATQAAASAATSAAEALSAKVDVLDLYDSIETAKSNANNAASAAYAAASTLSSITAVATTLAAGSSATAVYSSGVLTLGIPQGPKGESGIVTPISGLFAMSVDSDGNLYVYSNDDDVTAENWNYDSETGNLYYVIPEGDD